MTIKCLKGSYSLFLRKNRVYPVVDVFQMGRDFGHQVRIVIQLTDRQQAVYVPSVHKNRLASPDGFNVNRGDVTKKAKVMFLDFDPKQVRQGGQRSHANETGSHSHP
jgi:hypothetical protein